MKIKTFILTLTAAAVLAGTCLAAAASNFSDVSSTAWYHDAVTYCAEKGYVKGTSPGSFSPDALVTRAQFMTILGRMDATDLSKTSAIGNFNDVANTDYFAPYVYWAVNTGVTFGTDSAAFSPNSFVTREQMASFISRYLKYKNATLKESDTAPATFNDADQISSYAVDDVENLRKIGLLSGNEHGNVCPQKELSRAEAAAVFMRLREKMVEAGFEMPYPPIETTPAPSKVTEDANGEWFQVKNDTVSMYVDGAIKQLDLLTDGAKNIIQQHLYSYMVKSSNPAVVKSTITHRDIEAISKGTAKLTFTVYWTDDDDNYHEYNREVNVVVDRDMPVECESIQTTADKSEIEVGETTQLHTVFTPSNTTDQSVGYASSNKNIATVSSDGVVTGVEKGAVTIYSWSAESKRTCRTEITVTKNSTATFTLTDEYISEFNTEFTRLLNEERINEGLTGAVYSDTMYPASQLRANEMAQLGNSKHIRPDGSSARTAFTGVVKDVQGIAECSWDYCADAEYMLGTTPQNLAKKVFDTLMNSAPHKAIMMLTAPADMPESCGISYAGEVIYVAYDEYAW